MSRYSSRLITPPSEEEEIYPYRRVWASIATETAILLGLILVLLVVTRFVTIPQRLQQPLNLIIVLLPIGLWLIFSWWRERLVPRPRQQLIAVVVVSALVARAVGVPAIEDVFQVNRWLPLESAINRIIGYTFTLGLVQAFLIYLILRYTAGPQHFRVRLDGVAYGAASAIGYATITNLEYVLSGSANPLATAVNTFNQVALLSCTGIIVGYGLAEVTFNPYPFPVLLTATIALAAFITGAAVPLITGFTNTSLSPLNPVSTVNPVLGFLLAAGLLFVTGFVISFLFTVAERQEIEVKPEDIERLSP